MAEIVTILSLLPTPAQAQDLRVAETHPVAFLIYPDFQVLDLTGPLEVFALASRLSGRDLYRTDTLAAESDRPTPASCGLSVVTQSIEHAAITYDTIVVAGGQGTVGAVRD